MKRLIIGAAVFLCLSTSAVSRNQGFKRGIPGLEKLLGSPLQGQVLPLIEQRGGSLVRFTYRFQGLSTILATIAN